ncbi:MAG: 4-hydroxy-3-methylbut-2-enyl diphosphate reductase, partial [Candidatus Pacebacteria bacterium]|nr:4-hydroxy-3-methylbut-2-enyl diphosphate reductase [Candidatus Paceibacterota bacterium]
MEKPIEIKLAEKMGFCFGVKRAVGGVMTLKGNVDMLGPLIHNPQFVKKLEERGIRVVNDMTQISANRVIIRAHGLSNKLIEELKQKGLKIIDLTCPLVKSVQNHAKRMEDGGREVFIVGEKGHQEVETIKENLKNGLIISTLEEAKSLP